MTAPPSLTHDQVAPFLATLAAVAGVTVDAVTSIQVRPGVIYVRSLVLDDEGVPVTHGDYLTYTDRDIQITQEG